MSNKKIMLTCDLCGMEFQVGPHRYDGKYVGRYKIKVCEICWDGNWDGWNPRHEDLLLNSLAEHGLSVPERNENGLLPRD